MPGHEEAGAFDEAWRGRIRSEDDVQQAVLECRRRCLALGFPMTQAFLVATAMSELARNALYHAGGGEVFIRCRRGPSSTIELEVCDHGPGIVDVEQALSEGYSTRGTLGLGLPSVKRIMDRVTIESRPGQGVRVRAWKHCP